MTPEQIKKDQEAAHYNWLDDQNEKLEHKIQTQSKVIEKMREALEFYGSCDNWEIASADDLVKVKTKLTKDKESFGEVEQPGMASKLVLYGGSRARSVLKECEALEGGK